MRRVERPADLEFSIGPVDFQKTRRARDLAAARIANRKRLHAGRFYCGAKPYSGCLCGLEWICLKRIVPDSTVIAACADRIEIRFAERFQPNVFAFQNEGVTHDNSLLPHGDNRNGGGNTVP